MLQKLIKSLSICTVLVGLFLLAGCSSSAFMVPSSDNPDHNITSEKTSNNLGEFVLNLDSESLTADIHPADREAAYDVTRYVKITIDALSWDPSTRIWDIDVSIENPTPYIAFGPWLVFTETGEQVILDQDGFIWLGSPAQRCPVIAFAKTEFMRPFKSHTIQPAHIRIFWPDGWEGFNPIRFFIDVSFPNARNQPIVEELKISPSPIPESFTLNAFVKDWQAEPTGLRYVWVDLRPIGGGQYTQMFDDGQHNDLNAGDDIWGISFYAIRPDPPVALTVHALDWTNAQFENDVMFGQKDDPQCESMREIATGSRSGIQEPLEKIARNQDEWASIWALHDPYSTPPAVNFEKEMVIAVFLGARSSSGFDVSIDCVQFTKPPLENMVMVTYTENIAGHGCNTMPVFIYPFQMVAVPLYQGAGNFEHLINVYECP